MKKNWSSVKRSDVLQAIKLFNYVNQPFPEAKNTFLIYLGVKYPAKHIRGLAYKFANKKEILKREYSGGEETANFFFNLGFEVEYNREVSSIKNKKVDNNLIARLVLTGKQYDKNNNPVFKKLEKVIEKFLDEVYKKQHYKFILTPGGFLKFSFKYLLDVNQVDEKQINILYNEASKEVVNFFNFLPKQVVKKLKETADYMTIGIDGLNPENAQMIELVAIYDLRKGKILHWTGKSYLTDDYQRRNLIRIEDLNTHFLILDGEKLMVLGCHDLSIFNPRGAGSKSPGSLKGIVSAEMKKLCKKNNPTTVLQHPHMTEHSLTWNNSWIELQKEIPGVRNFASGLKLYNFKEGVHDKIENILKRTKGGDVKDFYFG